MHPMTLHVPEHIAGGKVRKTNDCSRLIGAKEIEGLRPANEPVDCLPAVPKLQSANW
jgi:hypothetical protein